MPTLDAPALVDAIISRLTQSYVFPDRAATAASLLRASLLAGKYASPVDESVLAVVNEDLFAACADKHLRLLWYASDESGAAPSSDADLEAELRQMFRLENHGVQRVERLTGNVGLIALTLVPEAAGAGKSIDAAMELVQYTCALILDLRKARGGAPDGVAYLASFFFPDADVRLSDIIEGPDGPARQYWTAGYVSGPRYLDRPVYALVSSTTFSGGEALAYDLQAVHRATVVGDVTRGGANPSTAVSLGDNIELRLPIARTVNPATGGNWEGVGVQPDILVPAADALAFAHTAILDAVLADASTPAAVREEARIARA